MVTPESMTRGIRKDGISSYSLISPGNVESWKPGFEVFSHGEPGRGGCPLCSIFKGFLYGVSIDPAKVWFELVIVYVCRFLGMVLDDMGGYPRKDRKGMYASVMDVTTFINSGVMLISG